MAETTKSVQVLRAFNGHNKNKDAEEKTRYFTRENEGEALEFLGEEEVQYRVENGFLAVTELPVRSENPGFRAPPTAEEAAKSATPTTSTRRRAPAPSTE